MWRGLIALGALVACLGGCVTSYNCNLVGCINQVTVLATLAAPIPNLDVEACLNGVCGSAQDVEPGVGAALEGELSASVRADANGMRIVIPLSTHTPKNGDVVAVRISRAADGVELVNASRKLSYRTHSPNGPDCPPVCTIAEAQM